jgi:Terminase small subunit
MAKKEGRRESDVLTARERAFVEQFLVIANGAKAAQAAGYSEKSAKVRATRLLNRPRVAAAIATAQQARAERVGIESDRVLAELEEARFLEYRALRDRSDCWNRSLASGRTAGGDASRRVDQASRNAWCKRQRPRD